MRARRLRIADARSCLCGDRRPAAAPVTRPGNLHENRQTSIHGRLTRALSGQVLEQTPSRLRSHRGHKAGARYPLRRHQSRDRIGRACLPDDLLRPRPGREPDQAAQGSALRDLIRLMGVMVDLYCASYASPPAAVTLDIDDTLDVVHGHQQLSFFNAHYDERCFLPIHVYDTAVARPVAVLLRPGKTPSGKEVRGHLRRLVRRIRRHWPATHITIRGDGHYSRPQVMAWCEENGIDFVFGLPGNAVLDNAVEATADDIRTRRALDHKPGLRGFAETRYQAKSWNKHRRACARIEATKQGLDIRFVVTSLETGSAEHVYQTIYCARGQPENLIKLHKAQLASDRTSCRSPLANQMRLILHTAAYWLILTVRDAIPKAHALATAEFATLRLRLLKLGTRVIETACRVRLAFAAACPDAPLIRHIAAGLMPAAP